jgi:alpha-tubulin suppressor-like RCC1 family protein
MQAATRVAGISRLMVVAVAAICACAGASPAYAGGPKPQISNLKAEPASVAGGGTTTITAAVSGAVECTLSSGKPVEGLPATFSCEAGSVDRTLVMPPNPAKVAKYEVTLTATGPSGSADAKAKVSVTEGGVGSAVAASGFHTCALIVGGHVWCWGDEEQGQLGNGKSGLNKKSTVPVEAQGITSATQVATGEEDACALLADGQIDCWGDDAQGQLGNGKTTDSAIPVEAEGIADATEVAAGERHTCALLVGGHVDCWGGNEEGQLGDGSTSSSPTPVEVHGIAGATQVVAGDEYTCALVAGGGVECWGENGDGQLGNATTSDSDTPAEVQGIANATQVSADSHQTCAVLASGSDECWGENENGELGNGTTDNSDIPVEVQGITTATQVATGLLHTCTLLASSHVECWGDVNAVGRHVELEEPDKFFVKTPVEVEGISSAVQLTAGLEYTCAVLSGGQIECWGANKSGQLGNDSHTFSLLPVEVSGIT